MIAISFIIILFIIYVAFSTLKQKIYFHPDINCSDYPTNIPDLFIDELHAWYVPSKKTNKVILYCHGNAGNISSRLHIIKKWNDEGYTILIYDYYGYGMSKGYPTESNFYKSGEKMLEYLLERHEKEDIVLYGESIGCAVVAYLGNTYEMPKMILQSGFSSIQEVAKEYLPTWLDWLLPFLDDFNTYELLKKYDGKILIMHSRKDEIISFSNAEKLTDYTMNLYEIEGTHNNPIFDVKKVGKFIEE